MSQIMVCQTPSGIALAADGKAVDLKPDGQIMELKVNRLFSLSQYTAIMAGGAAEGPEMCRSLQKFIQEESLIDIQDIYSAALPFLASEYDEFMRKQCEVLPIDPIHYVYFILGGFTERDHERPFRLHLLWTKRKLPQLDGDEILIAYTAPRLMSLEHKLNGLSSNDSPPEEILSEMKRTMLAQSKKNEEIGPPFSYALITRDGYRDME